MSTTVEDKITEIKGLIDVGDITDNELILWFNQFENRIRAIKKEYKTIWYPRIKNLSHYNIPVDNQENELVLWNDIYSVNIKDSNGEFKEAKKITQRDYKTEGLYYWYENTQIAIPVPNKTDNWFSNYSDLMIIKNKYLRCKTPNLSVNPEITSNSIKSVNIDFTDYFIAGMVVNLKCSSIDTNNGEYVIESVTSGEIILKDATLTAVTNDTYLIIEGAAISIPYISTGITKDSSVVVNVRASVNSKTGYYDYYSQVIGVKEYTSTTVLSFAYDSIPDSTDIYNVIKVFEPGIKITYKPVYYKAGSSTELILPDEWSEAYNYFIESKIHEKHEDYSEAAYKKEKAISMIKQYAGIFDNDNAAYPADNQITAEW